MAASLLNQATPHFEASKHTEPVAPPQTKPLSEAPKPSTDRLPPTWLLNNYVSNRGGCNYLAHIITKVPSSERTVRDQALRPLYTITRELCNRLEQAARDQSIPIPALPPVPENYADEAALPRESLMEMIKPHAHGIVNEILGYNTSLARDQENRGCSWEVHVATLCETQRQFMESMKAMGDAARAGDVAAVLMFYGQLEWEGSAESMQCLMEESARLRKEKGEVWWAEEAAPVIAANKTLFASYMMVGIEQ